MKQTKKVWKFFGYRECDAMASYFEQMAEEGWHLESLGVGITFRKGEPKKVRYEIEVFPKATDLDTRPEPATQEFSEYCQAAGWEFVCAFRKFCVFRTEDSDVVPIETDPNQRFEHIRKAVMPTTCATWILYLLCAAFFFRQAYSAYSFLNIGDMLMNVSLLIVCVCFTIDFLDAICWQHKSRKMLALNMPVVYGNEGFIRKFLHIGPVIILYCAICSWGVYRHNYYMLCSALTIFAIYGLGRIVAVKARFSREHAYITRFVIAVVLVPVISVVAMMLTTSQEAKSQNVDYSKIEIPLHSYELTGINDKTEELIDYEKEGSFLASRESYWIQYGNKGHQLCYEIIASDSEWILNQFWKENIHYTHPAKYKFTADFNISEQEAARWDAVSAAKTESDWYEDIDNESVYSFTKSEYVLRYPECLIVFVYDDEVTPQVVEVVKNLKNEQLRVGIRK